MKTHSSHTWLPELWLGLKLFLLSTGLAVGIRTLGPLLPLPATTPVVLALILLPTVLMSGVFAWRWYRHRSVTGSP
jgi:hypothetical protein